MLSITVDGRQIPVQERQMVLQACLDANLPIPYYCYHPGLSIVASCRICLVEVEGIPKLVPACQTPVRDKMVVFTNSSKAIANRKSVMEYLLISHPLDCPVCDQAGECYLQEYSFDHGRSESRFEEDKARQAKKDVGDHILLYSDRCIYCTRSYRMSNRRPTLEKAMTRHRKQKTHSKMTPGEKNRRAKATAGTGGRPNSQPEAARQPAPCPVDEVEEASIESFPASDPPGYGTGHA